MRFVLPPDHINKDTREQTSLFRSTRSCSSIACDAKRKLSKFRPDRKRRTAAVAKQAAQNADAAASALLSSELPRKLSLAQLKAGVLDGSIPSSAYDTACTSHAGMVGDPFIQTDKRSNKVFALANGHPTAATNIVVSEEAVLKG